MKSLLPDECPRDRRDGFLAWLVETVGLLADRADGTLAFAHLSFQEYLTAYHLETTAADPGERRAAFDEKLGDFGWWETLRLLAAQIEGRNPAFLSIVLETLVRAPVEGRALAFVGTVLADDLGPGVLLKEWQEHWLECLSRRWQQGARLCASAWAAARQEGRKALLAQALAARASSLTWLGWLRFEEFGKGWAALPSGPARPVARGLIGQLHGEERALEEVAAGRVLGGLVPLWPSREDAAGVLQIWPSHRRLAGVRLQSALAAGAPREALIALARNVMPRPVEDDLARHLARDLARDLARYLDRDVDRYLARDWARDLARDWARDVARDDARDWARDVVRYVARNATFDLAHDSTRDLARDEAPDLARARARNWARDVVRDVVRDLARDWARDWARRLLAIDTIPEWLEDFAMIEVSSLGRVAGRAFLASRKRSSRETFPPRFLLDACRLSLRPGDETELRFPGRRAGIDPLWPALARHVARRSTARDRKLLIDLARHPEKREPPLEWGLRFIVRGDLLLDDGSFLTLDELADEAGIERLPYLDEMEPELEVDWGDDDDEKAPGPPR